MVITRLAPSIEHGGGVLAIHDRVLVWFDDRGQKKDETKLDKRATGVARFGDEWLVRLEKQKQLARHSPSAGNDNGAGGFAVGRSAIDCFGVGRDDAVVVTRGDALELWSRDDKKKWSTKGTGPFLQALPVRDHVVALSEDGALYFFARDKGDALGALRLASVEPAIEWRLAHIDANIVVLALGDWLVWIDASTRKTVRRVRARAKVLELAADANHVAVAVEDGFVQAFLSSTGEPRAAFSSAHDDGIAAIALGEGVLFTLGHDGLDVRTCDRQTLDVAVRAASPITALASRGNVTAALDRAGIARVFDSVDLKKETGATITAGEGVVGLHLAKNGMVITAGRVLIRSPRPYNVPVRPGLLKGTPTAFVADDAYAFVGTQAGAVDVYELVSAGHVTSYALSSDDRITSLVRLASGPLLVVGTGALDGRVLIVDVADAKVIHRISPHEEAFGVTSLASDARGRIVASGSDDGSIALLDPQKGRVLARIRVSETPTSMAFEPSGRRLACVFADGTASIVTFAQTGATVSDLGLRGVSSVTWGDHQLVFGFKDGHVESGDRHARPSDRPAARPS
jgi:hypothetical protein